MSDYGRLATLAIVTLYLVLALVATWNAEHTLETFMFYVFAGMTVFSSAAIVFSKSIVRSATWLLGTLGSAAGLYLLLAANFLAAVQLIVYAGGILVLIVFGVMLTGQNPFIRYTARPREMLLAGLAGVVLFAGLVALLLGGPWPEIPGALPTDRVTEVRDIGNALLTDYLVPFEVVSVLLVAVMIGAAYLARPEKR
ncbi:MAG: NADH-quinone oxidoreductase subunit J [Planctomycetes bacterium]|nr:NADH-quinone oxidoreductase subunit J [Planctomycetota bacterium]